MYPSEDTIVEVNGKQVFSCSWVMQQMQCLMDLHDMNRTGITVCAVFTAISVLLSLAAIVIATV